MEPMGPDARVDPLLDPDETVLVTCHASLLCPREGSKASGLAGELYLTSKRLLHLGGGTMSADLDRIDEVTLRDDGLAVTRTDGDSILLGVEQPRLLRVQIAAARIDRRRCVETQRTASRAAR